MRQKHIEIGDPQIPKVLPNHAPPTPLDIVSRKGVMAIVDLDLSTPASLDSSSSRFPALSIRLAAAGKHHETDPRKKIPARGHDLPSHCPMALCLGTSHHHRDLE